MPRTTFSEAVKRANPLGDLQPPLPSPASSSPTGAGGLPQIHSTLPQLSTNPAPNALGSLGHFGQPGTTNFGGQTFQMPNLGVGTSVPTPKQPPPPASPPPLLQPARPTPPAPPQRPQARPGAFVPAGPGSFVNRYSGITPGATPGAPPRVNIPAATLADYQQTRDDIRNALVDPVAEHIHNNFGGGSIFTDDATRPPDLNREFTDFANARTAPRGGTTLMGANERPEQRLLNWLGTQPHDRVHSLTDWIHDSGAASAPNSALFSQPLGSRPLLTAGETSREPVGWQLYKEWARGREYPTTNTVALINPDGRPHSGTVYTPGLGRPRMTIADSNQRPERMGVSALTAIHEGGHVAQDGTRLPGGQTPLGNSWREVAPSINGLPYAEEYVRRLQADQARPVVGSGSRLTTPGGQTLDAGAMHQQATEHGLFKGRSMAELLNTNAGRAWLSTHGGFTGPDPTQQATRITFGTGDEYAPQTAVPANAVPAGTPVTPGNGTYEFRRAVFLHDARQRLREAPTPEDVASRQAFVARHMGQFRQTNPAAAQREYEQAWEDSRLANLWWEHHVQQERARHRSP